MTTPPTAPTETAADAAVPAADAVVAAAAPLGDSVPPVRILQGNGEGLQDLFFRGNGHTDAAIWTDGLFMLVFWFSMFFFVLLMGLMVYWCIIYRRRPGVPQPVSPAHNTPLEIFWTVVPSSALLVIFFLGFWGYMDKVVPAGGAMQLDVSAWKWDWGITYPDGTQTSQTVTLGGRQDIKVHALPEDTDVSVRLLSSDVIHSFWIPDYRMKMDVFPNRYTGYGFRTPKLGPEDVHEDGTYRDHWVFCAEYCGDLHSEMAAVLRVMPQADYEEWLASQGSSGDPVVDGQRLYTGKCATCHSVDGSNNIGPSWKDLYGAQRSFNDGSSLVADDNYIRESIYNPGAKIVQGYQNQMTPFMGVLGDDDVANIIAYMKSISVHAEQPAEGDASDPQATEGEAGASEEEG
ncbi:MAG: c-type cytochrome [Phycisphaerales bacterium JB059]